MAKMFCGLDFGTTNSSVALAGEEGVRILELDPVNDNPASLPSLLYMSREGEHIVGRAAANAFIDRNVDREVALEQVDLGIAIDGYVGSEPDKDESYRPPEFDSGRREAVRAHAMVEVNSPGRLFQSLKTAMRYRSHKGTEVFGQQYQIEELTAFILREIKHKVDQAVDENIDTAVFGRPVRFSTDPEEDAVAERRLRTAAGLAGFKNVVFFYEPVAACVEYAVTTDRTQRLMVVDIGGGTCDVCVMEFGGGAETATRLAHSKVLGVAGVTVAGDAIDREIIRAKLFPSFGSRSRYGPSQLPVPQYLFRTIADWQNLYKLNTQETLNWLVAMEMSSTEPTAIRALRCLIQRNYGYPVVREVEQAKKTLSFEQQARIVIEKEAIHIAADLERAEFAHIIEHLAEDMLGSVKEAETQAQINLGDVDYVLTTGGTSLIPALRHMLEDRYGAERLLERDTFTSVATGLAIVSRYV
ncbi:MAG: Hsp70 family protein [Candidatus Hydrogenedentes bacterium]|nr:Hsp70 family protein [Candidatus Hydrogenedentota bacterium]